MEVGTSEAEPIWTEFLRKLTCRGLRGVTVAVTDAREGMKAAVTKVLLATRWHCRVLFMENVLAYAGESGGRVVSAVTSHRFRTGDARGRQHTMAGRRRPDSAEGAKAHRHPR